MTKVALTKRTVIALIMLISFNIVSAAIYFYSLAKLDVLIRTKTSDFEAYLKLVEGKLENIEAVLATVSVLSVIVSFALCIYIYKVMIKTIKPIIENLSSSESKLSLEASKMKIISQELAESVTNQAASLQETSASLEEINSMIKQNTDNSNRAAKIAEESLGQTSQGQAIIKQLGSSMEKIEESVRNMQLQSEKSNKDIAEITKAIEEIISKTKVINDIVFQTKLLSFNASVEAARAGEAGKGFAVVAEEVGNLAQMSGKASQEISALLSESSSKIKTIIDHSTRSSSEAVSVISNNVTDSISISNKTIEIFNQIMGNSETVSRDLTGIAHAGNEQSLGVAEINKAIAQLDLSMGQLTTAANECNVSSKNLETQSDELKNEISVLQQDVLGKINIKTDGFIWDDVLLLKVDDMDSEHKVLIDKMNSLIHTMNHGNKVEMLDKYKDLASYTTEHFAHEEKFMESFDYVNIVEHKEIHRNLLAKVVDYQKKLSQNDVTVQEISNFLKDWLLKHIMGQDKKYAAVANSSGVVIKFPKASNPIYSPEIKPKNVVNQSMVHSVPAAKVEVKIDAKKEPVKIEKAKVVPKPTVVVKTENSALDGAIPSASDSRFEDV